MPVAKNASPPPPSPKSMFDRYLRDWLSDVTKREREMCASKSDDGDLPRDDIQVENAKGQAKAAVVKPF